ncbi:MAG: hypothetical protein WD468_11785 [Pirellulales bacterium]
MNNNYFRIAVAVPILVLFLSSLSPAALVDDFDRADSGAPGNTSVGAIPWESQDSFGFPVAGLVSIAGNQLYVGNGTPYVLDEEGVADPDSNTVGTSNMFAELNSDLGNNIRLSVDLDFGVVTGPDSSLNGFSSWQNEAQIHIRRPDGGSYSETTPGIVMVGIYPNGGVRIRASDSTNMWTNTQQFTIDGSTTSSPHTFSATTSLSAGTLQATIEVFDDQLRVAINGNRVADYTIDSGVPTLGLSRIALGKILRTSSGDGARFDVRYDNLDVELITSLGTPGDFNDDGVVDAADYVVWRKNDGTSNALLNDDGLGTPITSAHYDLWRANFGVGNGSGSSLVMDAPIPEPSGPVLAILSILILTARRFGRSVHDGEC